MPVHGRGRLQVARDATAVPARRAALPWSPRHGQHTGREQLAEAQLQAGRDEAAASRGRAAS
eukprot:1308653-Heterocapsa_arctica.AAC.1